MYYRDLFIGHRAFWKLERRAKYYDIYMKERKNWEKWPDSVSIDEIENLMQFIPKWDIYFRGKTPARFLDIYKQILSTIKEYMTRSLKMQSLLPNIYKKSEPFLIK